MKNKLIVLFLIWTSFLFAGYNEKKILLKKADRFTKQSEYEKANIIYLDLLEKYPDDSKIADRYITNLLKTSHFEIAGEFLEKHKNIFSELEFYRYKIIILIKSGKMKEAISLAEKLLDKNPQNITYYRELGNLFQSFKQYEFSRKLFLKGRKISKDDNLFSFELADNYQQTGEFSKAVKEIMKHLKNEKSFFHFDLKKLKGILKLDNTQIRTIGKIAENSGDEKLMEVYALCLAELGNYEEALTKFEYLNVEKLRNFAEENMAAGNLEIARKAWEKVLQKTNKPDLIAYAQIRIAEIFIYRNELDNAEKMLLQVYHNKKIQNYGLKYKTKANRLCREMLAEIAVRKHEPENVILRYLKEAEKFTYNEKERKEIEFEIIHYFIMNGDYDKSRELLKKNLENEEPSADIFKKGYFYSYLLAVMVGDSLADSLLTEIMINIPGNAVANDALFLSDFLKKLSPEERDKFLLAYRKKMLYDDSEALKILEEIYEQSKNEEILFLCGEWAQSVGDTLKAHQIFSHEFSDEILGEYAKLKTVQMNQNVEIRQKLAGDFLKSNPQSVFSPEFRELIYEKQIGEVVE